MDIGHALAAVLASARLHGDLASTRTHAYTHRHTDTHLTQILFSFRFKTVFPSSLYLHRDGALGVALVRQCEAEGAAPRATSILLVLVRLSLLERRRPPDEEAGGGEDGPQRSLLQLEEQRRALGVRGSKLEDKVLALEGLQFTARRVEGRWLVD